MKMKSLKKIGIPKKVSDILKKISAQDAEVISDVLEQYYRASKPGCIPFPKQGDPELDIGIPRNYEIFTPLDFLAAVTQPIPTAQKL